ncbi:MAG: OmpA family protein [Campylobacterales bacterium]|nr:OmpA family protein [Campylobacterales bacterium]
MKNVLAISTIAALLLFSGCSQKDPAIDATDGSQATQSTGSTVDVKDPSETSGLDDSGIEQSGTADSNEQTLSTLESKFESIQFDFDKFVIRADMQNKLENNAALSKAAALAYNVKLEGNCDEWGSDEYNYALGLKRAKSTKDALVAEGVDASRITMVSFGESNPVCTEQTRECWAQNRRVDFKLLP